MGCQKSNGKFRREEAMARKCAFCVCMCVPMCVRARARAVRAVRVRVRCVWVCARVCACAGERGIRDEGALFALGVSPATQPRPLMHS